MLNQRSSLRPFWTSMLSRVCLTWTSGWPCEMQLVQNRSTSAMPVEVMRCHNFWGKKLQLWSVKSANMKHYETIGFEHSANTFRETDRVGWVKLSQALRAGNGIWEIGEATNPKVGGTCLAAPKQQKAIKSTTLVTQMVRYQILESTHLFAAVFSLAFKVLRIFVYSKWIHRKSSLAQVCLDGFRGAETVSSTERMSRNATFPWHLGTVCSWISRISGHYVSLLCP